MQATKQKLETFVYYVRHKGFRYCGEKDKNGNPTPNPTFVKASEKTGDPKDAYGEPRRTEAVELYDWARIELIGMDDPELAKARFKTIMGINDAREFHPRTRDPYWEIRTADNPPKDWNVPIRERVSERRRSA